MTSQPLPLYEEILLLALDEEKGSISIAGDKGKKVTVLKRGQLAAK